MLSSFLGFLSEASGYYIGLLEKVHAAFDLKFDGNEAFVLRGATDPDMKGKYAGLTSCHKSLIYLGDLARYKEFYSENPRKNWSVPFEYYHQAIKILPFSGNPYNQLAVLATYAEIEYRCIFNYYMGLLIEAPFETIKENLSLQFQKNKTKYLEFVNDPATKDRTSNDDDKATKHFQMDLIRVHGILFTRTG